MKLNDIANSIVWSDNWWIEGQYAWFVPGENSVLLMADFEKKEISFVDGFPIENKRKLRMYPRCIKAGRYIFCLPKYEKNFIRYDLESKIWKKISLNSKCEKDIVVFDYSIYGNNLYVISESLSKIIKIDIEAGLVMDEYKLGDNDEIVGRSIFTENYIYVSSSRFPLIYEFDIRENKVNELWIPDFDDSIHTLCIDENTFWISGRKRAIYTWNRKENKTHKLKKFPCTFGEYNFSGIYDKVLNVEPEKYRYPIFLESVNVGEFIWFIPYKTNKILYVRKKDGYIKEFIIDKEINSQEELKHHLMLAMYLFLYVREERYLGLYSLKKESILEIDCEQMSYKTLNYDLHTEVIKSFLDGAFMEGRKADLRMFRFLLKEYKKEGDYSHIGDFIYKTMKSET